MKILTFGASNSKTSINKALAQFTATLVPGAEIEVLDLSDYDLPIFSEDLEKEIGQPQAAKDFFEKIGSANGVIVSFAEHNGSYSAAYKNLFDWASRIDQKVFQDKPTAYLATSPGPGARVGFGERVGPVFRGGPQGGCFRCELLRRLRCRGRAHNGAGYVVGPDRRGHGFGPARGRLT